MTTEHRRTPEEEAYGRLLEEMEGSLSEAARTLLERANSAVYAATLAHDHPRRGEEFDEAMEKMRVAAAGLADRDRELLAEIVRASRLASCSIDPDDELLPVGYKLDRRHHQLFYGVVSDTVRNVLGVQTPNGEAREGFGKPPSHAKEGERPRILGPRSVNHRAGRDERRQPDGQER